MTSITLESASGVLSLLKSEDPRLKTIALKKIDKYMDHYWHEIAERVADIEALHEDESFKDRQLAALISSKLYYHLEEYDEAVDFALQAGPLFDINERSQYIDCLIGKCIDRYISERQSNFEKINEDAQVVIDSKLEEAVEKILNRCIQEKESKMVLGLALDARRVDKISEVLKKEEYSSEILDYLTRLARNVVASRKFRVEIFKIIVESYKQRSKNTTDYINLSQSYFILDDSASLAGLLVGLVQSGQDEQILLAYQIATDINENENNFYFEKVIQYLHLAEEPTPAQFKNFENLKKILNGRFKNELYLTFLKEKNQADPAVVNQLKGIIDIKNSVAHGGVIFANSLINAGTTNDAFLRNNIDWVAKASHWSKFSATSSLGVIHKGNYAKAMSILQPYFPGATATPSWYTHGGSLYGLGLIHYGDKDRDVIHYLIEQIKSPDHIANEQIIHGACLGLGMVCLASENEGHRNVYEDLKNVLFTDSANSSEAGGLAIGMVMLGSAAQTVIDDLLEYAHETQHEKIIRAIAIALAFIMYGKEEKADALIDQLSLDKDGILRYGAMYMIGLAYIGTSNNAALKKLLLFAVSDVSDDVRRAAVINVGLLMLKQPEQVPKILSLLAMSYNAHVRYGSTLALGIACAGTAQQEALKMLEPMLNDPSDFVRQGAYIATAMILQQVTVAMEPKVEKFRTQLEEIVKKKHEDPLARLGALLSFGILDAGGRNASISLVSQFGYPKIASVVGVVLFLHFWYWFPVAHSILLSFSPTCLIGVNKDLKAPKGFNYKSNAKPSLYAYPEHIKENKEKEKAKVTTAQLSITQKVKARALARNQSTAGGDVEETKKEEKMDIEPTEEKKKEEEPDFAILENPSRVLPSQRAVISFLDDNRYKPILKERKSGILFLLDTKGGTPDEFFGEEGAPKPTSKPKEEELDVPVPDAFKYEDDDEGETQKLLK